MKETRLYVAAIMLLLPIFVLNMFSTSQNSCCLVANAGYVNVSVSEAKQLIDTVPELVVLDVRTLEEYRSGHIEDAVLIPVSELAGKLDELDKNKSLLVYCRTGSRSAAASQILIDNGFSSVFNMVGGITSWIGAGFSLRYSSDLNNDGMVNIQDITIVAIAYNSRADDPNWNSLADLDKNGWINILDISTVARDFGKAVSHNGEVDFFFSFEDDMQEWEARAMDLELGNSTIEWSIVQSQERAKNGSSALKFYLENWNDMGKIWIERCFVVKPNTMYGVNVSYAFASADWGVANFFRIITGVLQEPPKTRDELVYQGDTGNDHPDSDVGYVWLDKSYAFTFQSNANGETYVILGVWGVWETPRTYYLDSIRVVFTQL